MKTFYNFISFIAVALLFGTSSVSAQWQTVSSGTNEGLNKVAFFSATTGFIAGNDGLILRTNDGGATWQQVAGSQNIDFHDIASPSPNIYVLAGELQWNQPAVAISYDGGNNWWLPLMPANVKAGISAITFVTPSIGYATAGSYVMKTIDGGLTWSATQIAYPYFLNHVAFANSLHGVISGGLHDETGFTMHTNDGGATWTYDNDSYIEPIFTSQILDANNAWRVGGDPEFGGYISRTTDAGASWSHTILPNAAPGVADIHFADATHGVAISGIQLLQTNDAGGTWTSTKLVESGNPLSSMTVDQSGAYWIVGWNGIILKSAQSPSSVQTAGATLASFALAQNYPNPVATNTQFTFTLPSSSQATLKIYSVDGKEVKTLVSSSTLLDVGAHTYAWDATDESGARVASGTYIYKLTAGEETVSKRLTVVQ